MTVKNGHLIFRRQGAGSVLRRLLACPRPRSSSAEAADQLADRLARSGVNLVRLGDLDAAYGPDRSLFDDARDDTKEFDPVALERLDHLIAALKKRGIYVAIELPSKRRFRVDDGVALPVCSLPAAAPRPSSTPRSASSRSASAKALLGHKNPETELALKEDPALAWVTLAGETSMFDLIDNPDALPAPYAKKLRELAERRQGSAGHRFWESLESAHLKKMADALRKDELRAPVAGVSHWRREAGVLRRPGGAGAGPDRRPAVLGAPALGLARAALDALGPAARGLEAIAERQAPGRPALCSGPVVQPDAARPGRSRTKRPTSCSVRTWR